MQPFVRNVLNKIDNRLSGNWLCYFLNFFRVCTCRFDNQEPNSAAFTHTGKFEIQNLETRFNKIKGFVSRRQNR